MITIYYRQKTDDAIRKIDKLQEGAWIHIEEASSTDIADLAKITQIEIDDLQDSFDRYEIPRLEKIEQNVLLFVRFPIGQEAGLYTQTLTIILTKEYFITICPGRTHLIERFMQQFQFATKESVSLLMMLLSKINQEYTSKVRRIRYNILSAEREMIHVNSEDITTLTKNEEVLNQYLASLLPIRKVIQDLMQKKYLLLNEDDEELLEDLLNAFKQSEELCSIVVKSIRSLRDAYQILFTNNLNKTIKMLTALTIVLSLPTMISSVYGMNVALPLASKPYAFSVIMALTVFISGSGIILFRRKGWF